MPLIYPVFLRHPGYDCESDSFFCGSDILVCPVFDRGSRNTALTLPACENGWLLRGAGEAIPGNAELTVSCLPEDEPVWFLGNGQTLNQR